MLTDEIINQETDCFNLKYFTTLKPPSRVPVTVELNSSTGRLRAIKYVNGLAHVVEDVSFVNIGAVADAEICLKRNRNRKCLIVFWKGNREEGCSWNWMIFSAKGKNGIEDVKAALKKACLKGTFRMETVAEHEVHELQFSSRFVSFVSESGYKRTKSNSNLTELCTSISGSIFEKFTEKITVMKCPASSAVKFQLPNSEMTPEYYLSSIETENKIQRLLSTARNKSLLPLPPIPQIRPPIPAPRRRPIEFNPIEFQGLLDSLKHYVPPPTSPEHYYQGNDDNNEVTRYLGNKMAHVRRMCDKDHTHRFNQFINMAPFGPSAVGLHKPPGSIYATPILSAKIDQQPNSSISPQDSVESTLTECLGKVDTNRHVITEVCPIGLTREEREILCWRLDLLEYDIVRGPGWRNFAECVMHIDNDDLEMIDEFSCRYKYQVMEIVLDHWYKLHYIKSRKLLRPAVKQSIVEVLLQLDKLNLLLDHLRWLTFIGEPSTLPVIYQ